MDSITIPEVIIHKWRSICAGFIGSNGIRFILNNIWFTYQIIGTRQHELWYSGD